MEPRPGGSELDILIRVSERETFDQPLPPIATALNVVLVKYLSHDQLLTAAGTAT